MNNIFHSDEALNQVYFNLLIKKKKICPSTPWSVGKYFIAGQGWLQELHLLLQYPLSLLRLAAQQHSAHFPLSRQASLTVSPLNRHP